jgi:hypothetical protein
MAVMPQRIKLEKVMKEYAPYANANLDESGDHLG